MSSTSTLPTNPHSTRTHRTSTRPRPAVRRPSSRLAAAVGAAGLALALAACGSGEPGSAEEAIAEAAAGDDVPQVVKDFAESMDDAGSSESEPSTGSSSASPRDLPAVGECLDHLPHGDEGQGVDIPIVDCAGEHAGEVFAVVALDGQGESYPGLDKLFTGMSDGCGDVYLDRFGGPVTDTGIGFGFIAPPVEAWEDGDTDVLCYAYPATLGTYSGELKAENQ